MKESEETGEFKVSDKRRFTPEGAAKEAPAGAAEEKVREEPKPTETKERTASKEPPRPLDFSTFILSLANTALFQLGLVKVPESEAEKDLQAARQTIDLIALLEEKTRGNLSDLEQKIITETLFQLRMAFVEASK